MNKKPVLVVMAAGMGSRYGGLKQMDPMDEEGHIIMDFSIFDAKRAGFEKVVFIVKDAIIDLFKEKIGSRIEKYMEVEYVCQEFRTLPEGCTVPEGREKPFGTGHAILCCKDIIDGPFAVINADDFYGADAYRVLYEYLTHMEHGHYAMVGFQVMNTLTDNGYVSRGICARDENGKLVNITERTHIEKKGNGAAFTEDDGATWTALDQDDLASMNFWGFDETLFPVLEKGIVEFFETKVKENPLKSEYLIPNIVGEMLQKGETTVEVLSSSDKWFGVTYKEDKPMVMESIRALKAAGKYPEKLWA